MIIFNFLGNKSSFKVINAIKIPTYIWSNIRIFLLNNPGYFFLIASSFDSSVVVYIIEVIFSLNVAPPPLDKKKKKNYISYD